MNDSATGLTAEDLVVLQAPFQAQDHKFVKGSGNKYFAYIDEDAIMTRIESVDPSAGWSIDGISQRKDGDTHSVSVYGTLTIKGVSRSGMGSESVKLYSYTQQKTGEAVVGEANEAEKSAATDALKRAARMFGIGRYLLTLPEWVSSIESMDKWLQQNAMPTPLKSSQKPAKSAFSKKQVVSIVDPENGAKIEAGENGHEDSDGLFDMTKIEAFYEWAKNKLEVTSADISTAMMGVFKRPLGEVMPTLTKTQVIGAIIAWMCEYDADMVARSYSTWPQPIIDAATEYALIAKVTNAPEIGF